MSFDDELLKVFNQDLANPHMDLVMTTFSILGLTLIWLSVALPLWLRNKKRTAIELAILIILIDVIVLVIKLLVARDRPSDIRMVIPPPLGFSFPSGHAARAFGAFILLSFSFHRRLYAVPLFLYALMIALSRLYLGVHFPSDVLAGAFAGLVLGYVFVRISRTAVFRDFVDMIIEGIERLTRAIAR
jgi:undecaprenyl-diphosphatase